MVSLLFRRVCGVAVAGFLGIPAVLQAQSITLTGPSSSVQVPDGDDFGTDVVGNPMDMSHVRDIGIDYNFTQPSVAGGIWSANGLVTGSFYVTPLSGGFLRPGYESYYSWYDNGTPYGPRNPINAGKFSRFSIRTSLPQSQRSTVILYWSKNYNVWPAATDNKLAFVDGENNAGDYPSGFRIYDFDPDGTSWTEERISGLMPTPQKTGESWSGVIQSFTFWPTIFGAVGTEVKIDWMRIYDPSTSPTVAVTWATSGVVNDGQTSIQLYLDNNNSGFDGDLFASPLSNDGRFTIRTAALPPGTYYAYVRAVRHNGGGYTELARSGYSAAIVVGAPPIVTITAPSFTSGVDFATSELGNPWDMSDSADVVASANVGSPIFSGGLYTGLARGPASGRGAGDSQLLMNQRKNGATIPINTRKYRYLSFRMKADESAYSNVFDRITRGWVTRLVWWKTLPQIDGTLTKDVPLFEDWHTYTVDLWDNNAYEVKSAAGVPQPGWDEVSSVNYFRFDPMEVFFDTRFWLDEVKLCADNEATAGKYTVRWNLADADSASLVVRVYGGYYQGQTYIETPTPLAVVTTAPGAGSAEINTSAYIDKTLFVRIAANDGTTENSYISKVGINVTIPKPTSRTAQTWGDYDGDGAFDLTSYETARGDWYIKSLATGQSIMLGQNWGFSRAIPVPGDYNGDGKFDLAVYDTATGAWYIIDSVTKAGILVGTVFGSSGHDPVPGDYNGDGVWDLAVYQRGTGNWSIRTVSGQTLASNMNWGFNGAFPVHGDYNADGKDDLAVYHKAAGRWYIRSLVGPALLMGKQWGTSGMTPVPGDYNGDGLFDLGLYETASGNWYILSTANGAGLAFGQNWGSGGMTPVPGDYNGDGIWEQAVWDRGTANWYIKNTSGAVYAFGVNWGKP